jgi:hypothetical protein
VAGSFGPAAIIAPPAGRAAASNGLASVSCSALGRCAAVGTSAIDPGQANPALNYPLGVIVSGGTPGSASLIARMPDAASPFGIAQLRRAACDGAGTCMAIGMYRSVANRDEPMAVSESGGKWGAPTRVTAPPGSEGSGAPFVDLLACPGTGPCVAVGGYDGGDRGPHLMSAGNTPTPATSPPAAPTGTLSLVASRIGARSGGRAIFRLRCTGNTSCKGRLRLTARRAATRKRRAGKATLVARKSFTIAAGKRGRITIRLNARGRALLRGARSQLAGTLTVLKTSPAPSRVTTRRIRLIKPGH